MKEPRTNRKENRSNILILVLIFDFIWLTLTLLC